MNKRLLNLFSNSQEVKRPPKHFKSLGTGFEKKVTNMSLFYAIPVHGQELL